MLAKKQVILNKIGHICQSGNPDTFAWVAFDISCAALKPFRYNRDKKII